MYNPFSLENKTILVTGASSGIGKAIAIECSKMGAKVVITGRNEQRLQETYEQLEGAQPAYIVADLTKKEDIETLIKQIGSLNGLVNCAGLTITKPFKFLQEEDIQEVMTVNFNAPLLLTQLLIKKKKLQKISSIVFISSISGTKVSLIGNSIYSPLKRYGKPEEVAYAVVYLLSGASSWVTGSNLLIDGGYTLL